MKKIKIIDLLSRIANKDNIPPKIIYMDEIYTYVENFGYMTKYGKEMFLQSNIVLNTRDLNGYVELMNEKILDDVEKEYLSNVIKPFRERVISIEKIELSFDSCTERNICIKMDDESFILPILRNSNYYKGMKCNFDYPIEELGL